MASLSCRTHLLHPAPLAFILVMIWSKTSAVILEKQMVLAFSLGKITGSFVRSSTVKLNRLFRRQGPPNPPRIKTDVGACRRMVGKAEARSVFEAPAHGLRLMWSCKFMEILFCVVGQEFCFSIKWLMENVFSFLFMVQPPCH